MILGKLYRKSVLLPLRKTLHYFGFLKKRAEIFLTSVFKMPDKTSSKEKLNLLNSGSVSSPEF